MFRKSVIDIDQYLPIFYVPPIIYELNEEFLGSKYLYAEPMINCNDQSWMKYSNNASYCGDEN